MENRSNHGRDPLSPLTEEDLAGVVGETRADVSTMGRAKKGRLHWLCGAAILSRRGCIRSKSARFLPDSYIEKQTMGWFSVRIQRRQKTVSHMRFDDQALLPTLLASAYRIAMLLRDSMATMYESGKNRADLGRTRADVGAWGAATRDRACAVLARGVRWPAPAPTPSYRISHGDRIPHPFARHGDANAWADLFVGGASPCG